MDDKKKIGDDLFVRMADTLRNHAEPYEEGAWERFASRNPDVLPGAAPAGEEVRAEQVFGWSPWKWGIAAALLLLAGISVFWLVDLDRSEPEGAGEQRLAAEARTVEPATGVDSLTVEPSTGIESLTVELSAGSESPLLALSVTEDATPAIVPSRMTAMAPSDLQLERLPVPGLEAVETQLATLDLDLPHLNRQTGQKSLPQTSDPYAWMQETASVATARQAERPALGEIPNMDKWDIGLVLTSAMTTEQLNLGGGVSFAYRLSDRVSLRSGLALGRYGVNTEGAGPGTRVQSSFDSPVHPSKNLNADSKPERYTRQLNATTSSLLTMDIPIDLKYSWTNQFYTSVGVSFLGILNEDRTYHFIDRINEPVFTDNVSAGNDIAYSVRAFHVEERAAEQPLNGKGYAGFLNFSVGHRTPLSKKINLSIEPFFKLPVGRLSNEDMNLTNGGIRIVTGF